jgi:DNA repair exonuclease SbcCD ATPase subunit
MYSWLSSNVIQTIGDNINHGINNAVTALENFDDEYNNQNTAEEEEDRLEEAELYKKLLEEAQMQHVELSKQFQIALYEKDAELLIWKKKFGDEDQKEGGGRGAVTSSSSPDREMEENKTNILLTAEINALKSILSELEDKTRLLLREKNEMTVKLHQFPELLHELTELKKSLQARNENEAKKSDEIDDLVQEYSKLAADSEKQKSSDSLHLKELERENEILTIKLQALEQTITELADRSTSLPGIVKVSTSSVLVFSYSLFFLLILFSLLSFQSQVLQHVIIVLISSRLN